MGCQQPAPGALGGGFGQVRKARACARRNARSRNSVKTPAPTTMAAPRKVQPSGRSPKTHQPSDDRPQERGIAERRNQPDIAMPHGQNRCQIADDQEQPRAPALSAACRPGQRLPPLDRRADPAHHRHRHRRPQCHQRPRAPGLQRPHRQIAHHHAQDRANAQQRPDGQSPRCRVG